jgi:hypothetical protein
MLEIPEAHVEPTNQTSVNLTTSQIKLILVYLLRPQADDIDYGQIYPKLNGAAASRISEVRPGLRGKVLRIQLGARPGFDLLPGSNAVEIVATDRRGQTFSARFNVHTPAGECRGEKGRARILELPALLDLLRAGVAGDRMIRLVMDCGVSFQPTSETDQKLTDAGADPILVGIIHDPASPEYAKYATKTVRLDELLKLLRSGLPQESVAAAVEDEGVDFEYNSSVEEKLRDAGATQKLIETVRYMAGSEVSGVEAKALSVSQIVHLLQGGVDKNRVFDLVQQRGVSFRLDNPTEQKLRDAGANEKLMRAIRSAAEKYETSH